MTMTTINRWSCCVIGAGLLFFSSFAPAHAEFSVRSNAEHINVEAEDASLQELIEEIALQFDLRLVSHISLDRRISISIVDQLLPAALEQLLATESYQLFMSSSEGDEAIPGTLWLFSEGSAQAPASTVYLEAAIYAGSYREKKEAIRELRRLGTPVAVQSLSIALSDEDSRVRDAAMEALRRIGTDEALAAIASVALDGDPAVRGEALAALSSGDTDTGTQYLLMSLDDPDPRVRISVIEALADVPYGDVPGQQAVDALNRALRDDHPDVRMAALDSLEDIGGDIAFQALMQAKMDQDAAIVEAADESLQSINR